MPRFGKTRRMTPTPRPTELAEVLTQLLLASYGLYPSAWKVRDAAGQAWRSAMR